MLMLLISFINCSNGLDESDITNNKKYPKADFSLDKPAVKRGESINFSNSSQNAASYLWDFGDGSTSSEMDPTHSYENYGSYTVMLTASNDNETNTFKKRIFVKEFTVMTYNIAFSGGAVAELYEMWDKDGWGKWNHDRLPELLKIIRKVNPDILGIQEAYCWDSDDPPVYKKFANSLGMKYYYYPERDVAEWNGICIYSKYPIKSTHFLLHKPCDPNHHYNGAYVVKVNLDMGKNKTLDVLVCHLSPHMEGMLTCEVEGLYKYLISKFSRNTILMGDMNFADYDSKDYCDLLTSAHLHYLNPIIGGGKLTVNIDQIWASKNLHDLSEIHDMFSTNMTGLEPNFDPDFLAKASDHNPVFAHFGFE